MKSAPAIRLVIAQRRLTHYREAFFTMLRQALAERGVELVLVVGNATETEALKRDQGTLPWTVHAPCHYWLGGRLCWQPFGQYLKSGDFVVVTQENKLLYNLFLLPRGDLRVALWGHGENLQARGLSVFAQRLKRVISMSADWWFAYTDLSAGIIVEAGYDPDKVTVLNNAIDTAELARQVATARATSREELREKHGLPVSGPLGLFVGSLYEDKRLDLLLEGAEVVRKAVPGFTLAVVGQGPMQDWLKERTAQLPWVRLLGAQRGQAKADLLVASDVLLNPGLVGLGILDSFVAELPLVTTDCKLHSPEIAYLVPGENGLMSAPQPAAFAGQVIQVLSDTQLQAKLAAGCKVAASELTLPAMVRRFCDGVDRWRARSMGIEACVS